MPSSWTSYGFLYGYESGYATSPTYFRGARTLLEKNRSQALTIDAAMLYFSGVWSAGVFSAHPATQGLVPRAWFKSTNDSDAWTPRSPLNASWIDGSVRPLDRKDVLFVPDQLLLEYAYPTEAVSRNG